MMALNNWAVCRRRRQHQEPEAVGLHDDAQVFWCIQALTPA